MSGIVEYCSTSRFAVRASVVCAAFAAWLAWQVTPWYTAAPVQVRLGLEAPAASTIGLSWEGVDSGNVPFVPVLEPRTPTAKLWLAELPPRPAYRLAIQVASPLENAAFDELTIVNTLDFDRPIQQFKNGRLPEELLPDRCEWSTSGDRVRLSCHSSGALSLVQPVGCRPDAGVERFIKLWVTVSAMLIFCCVVTVGLIRASRARVSAADGAPFGQTGHKSLAPIAVASLLGLVVQLAVAADLPVAFDEFDPLGYFHKAVWLVEKGTYVTDTPYWEIDRLPGYPVFIACCLTLFGFSLKAIAIVQTVLFGAALFALGASLRHWISPRLCAAAVLVALVSPVAVQHMLAIGTEGLFSSLAVFALAAFFQHMNSQGRASLLWLIGCGLAIAAATLVRPNGIVLLAAPAWVWLLECFRGLRTEKHWAGRLQHLARATLRYATPVLLVAGTLGGWAVRNAYRHDFFAPTSMVGVSQVEGLMVSSTFDARSLLGDALYEPCVCGQHRQSYRYGGWGVRTTLYDQLTQNGTIVPPGIIPDMNRRMKEIALRSEALSPWQLKAAGLLRSVKKSWDWPSLRYVGNENRHIARWERFCTSDARAGLGRSVALPDLDDQDVSDRWAARILGSPVCAGIHRELYRILYFAGFAFSMLIVWSYRPMLAAPAMVFLANVALNTWLLNVRGRYIQPLEFALLLQTALGLEVGIGLVRRRREERAARELIVSIPLRSQQPRAGVRRAA